VKEVMSCLVAGCLAGAGCGESVAPEPLCDASNQTAGRVGMEARTVVERLAIGEAVLFDNGGPYVFVDGKCNYWVSNPSQMFAETHTGTLDAETAIELGSRLHFNAWEDLSGDWSDPYGGTFDAPILIFDNSRNAVVCRDHCDASEVPSAVKAMRDAMIRIAQELWDDGAPAPSSLRVVATPAEAGPGIPFVDWPLVRPFSDFVRTGDVGFGEGTLEEDVESVRVLKELRRSFLDGEHGAFVWGMLPVKSGGAYYNLYIRDTLPFEDASGLVPLTGQVANIQRR